MGKPFTELGPQVSGPLHLLTTHASLRPTHASDPPVIAISVQRPSPPVATGGRCPLWPSALSPHMGWQRKPCTISPPLVMSTPLWSTRSPLHESTTVATTVPAALSSPKLANQTVYIPSLSSTFYELEPPTNNPEVSSPLAASFSTRCSISLATARPPPAPSPPRGTPHNPTDRLRPIESHR
jgi:hypothetical protein